MAIDIKNYKKVLYINLSDLSYVYKIDESLWEYIGGVGVSYKLMDANFDQTPIILSTGPLSGYFPYASKASLLYLSHRNLVEKYGGGSISGLMNMVGIDSIVIYGTPSANVSVSISDEDVSISEFEDSMLDFSLYDFVVGGDRALADNYFSFGDMSNHNTYLDTYVCFSINNTKTIDLNNFYDYERLYNNLLEDYKKLTVEPRNNPSCLGCPMGCDLSSAGEDGLNISVLPRALVSCGFAESIYKHIPTVYACLSSIGYVYHHSDLEKFSTLFGNLKANLNAKIA